MQINSTTLAAFLAGTVLASACVYVGAVRPLQAQITKDQATMDSLAKNNAQTTAELEQAVARMGELQGELNARGPQPVTSVAPSGQGMTGYDALNVVRPGLGTVLQKAAPVISQAMQKWQASHALQTPIDRPIVLTPECTNINAAAMQRNLTDSETLTYEKCWGHQPLTHATIDCTGLDTISNQRALTAAETRDYQQCFGRMPRSSETIRTGETHPANDPGCSVVSAMVNNGEALSDVERAEYNRCTLQ